MQLIRCTQKLLKELKHKPATNIEPFKSLLGSWHANLLLIERRKCVLFINDSTLFTILVPYLKKLDFQNLNFVFQEHLFKNLLHEDCSQKQIEAVLTEHNRLIYTKTNSRSILGSMNEQKFQLEYRIQLNGGLKYTPIYDLNKELNRNLLSPIDYKRPFEMLKEKLKNIK